MRPISPPARDPFPGRLQNDGGTILRKPINSRPTAYFDDDVGLVLNGITVYEKEEPLAEVSRILDPAGEPILYFIDSEKLGHLGFVCPSDGVDNFPDYHKGERGEPDTDQGDETPGTIVAAKTLPPLDHMTRSRALNEQMAFFSLALDVAVHAEIVIGHPHPNAETN